MLPNHTDWHTVPRTITAVYKPALTSTGTPLEGKSAKAEPVTLQCNAHKACCKYGSGGACLQISRVPMIAQPAPRATYV